MKMEKKTRLGARRVFFGQKWQIETRKLKFLEK